MCGIVGSFGETNRDMGARMVARLAHRGPTGDGEREVSGNWIGHRRCAAANAKGGTQPFVNEAGDLFMVGDGMIYNRQELRESLTDVQFRTGAHSEVALHLFEDMGVDAFEQLSGMFAFIIAGDDGRFVAARDPVGMKPLYWARRDDQVLFASEMKAYDEEWLPAVEFFPPGHYWTPETGLMRFEHAVSPDSKEMKEHHSPEDIGDEIPEEILTGVRNQLIKTVEGQLPDDVRVGVLLSGGLDSNLIAAIAARWYEKRGERLKTFTVGLGDSPDLHAARAVAEYLGTEHHEELYTAEEALELVPEVVRSLESFDPSLVRSSVPNYMVSLVAAKDADVVLTGEGSDEIFAGYDYLERYTNDDDLQQELIRGFNVAHNGGLQRVDRVTMAHGLEAQLPFLDLDVIDVGFSIHAGWKTVGQGQPEKRLLREAFSGWLPDEFLWREKAQFGEGSGAITVLQRGMEESVTAEEFQHERTAVTPPLRTREEVAYYRIFAEHLPGARPERTISRFVTT